MINRCNVFKITFPAFSNGFQFESVTESAIRDRRTVPPKLQEHQWPTRSNGPIASSRRTSANHRCRFEFSITDKTVGGHRAEKRSRCSGHQNVQFLSETRQSESRTMSREDDTTQIPDLIYDPNTRTQYKKGRFFGKVSACVLSTVFCPISIIQKNKLVHQLMRSV